MTYPIGLITTDELYLAGGISSNNGYYLYSGLWYWASSPSSFDGWRASVRAVYNDGSANVGFSVNGSGGVRPVINLKAEVLAQGSGTAEDPYRFSS